MTKDNYSVSFTVDAAPATVFNHINNVSKWWTEDLEGNSQKTGDVFTVRFGDVHISTQQLMEVIPDRKVAWLVTGSRLNFIKDQQEWNNTTIIFEITSQDNKTLLKFTHAGLVPGIECYKDCTKGWDYYIKGSLFKLLTEGKGTPG